ncbi:MAG: SAM-dependent methyltransferase, partial [Acidimicrobiales bacterium]|nr:SAM-dependent methyltransferase [Acidimicrobiales bacterium]
MSELKRLLVSHIETSGPISFDEYQAQCLYAPEVGFYSTGHGAGRRRDFITSPEVGPLFGAVVGRALDAWWREAGEPTRLHLVEVGAGPGTLAKSILRSEPDCLAALSITLVETSEPQRHSHPDSVRSLGRMPKFVELNADMVVVLANELLDNMPVALVERRAHGWCEVLVGVENGVLVELFEPLGTEQTTWCELRAPSAPEGTRMPVQSESVAWLRGALELIGNARDGRVVVVDYARPASIDFAELPQSAWLRTYAQHGRSDDPYESPGELDITCDVA